MAHRMRSKTAESNDAKKSRGTPRRLTEKIANMRKREHEQSEAFEQAMKSIFEMQRARIHSGGGSMPSLQAIDSTPPGPSIDMQMIFQDFNEVQRQGGGSSPYSTSKERPHSSGPAGRRVAMAKANSVETDPYPVMGMGHNDPGHYWNASPEWIDGDLSRHKSDSDLQQSLLMQQQASPQHAASPLLGSPQTPRNHKIGSPGELGLWGSKRRPNSMTHALLSPDQYTGSPDAPIPSPLGMSGGGGATSSLPDLTNIEFSCGLDVPLERDEPINDAQPPPQQQQQIHVPIPSIGQPFHSPPGGVSSAGPGPSKLIYSSYQVPLSPSAQQQQQQLLSSFPPPYPSSIPVSSFGLRNPSPLAVQTMSGGIQRSTTMPDFRNLNSSAPPPSQLPLTGHPFGRPIHPHPNPTPQFRPILPSIPKPSRLPVYRPPPGSLPTFVPQIHTPPHGMATPPPMTIIIQPPPNASTVNSIANNSTVSAERHFQQQQQQQQQQHNNTHQHNNSQQQQHQQQQQQHQQQQQQQQQVHSPLQAMSPQTNGITTAVSNVSTPPPIASVPSTQQPTTTSMPPTPGSIHSLQPSALPGSPHKPSCVASLPTTPVATFSPGLPALPSYFEAKQQQALQLKFASINVGRNEALVRSHSEENLQKAQKDKSDVIQHNPFMGTLANANSVPCVYVEPSNTDFDYLDRSDSPTPGDSPSTSASYASSPPSVRPFWMEHPQDFNEFMFNKWPLEGASNSTTGSVGGIGGIRTGSPPIHHRSLSDLNAIPPELVDLSPTGRNKSLLLNHQLSLPSIAMTDLTMDEQLDGKPQNLNSPSDFYLPPDADFEMEDAVMDSLLKSEVPDLQFDVQLLANEANMLASEAMMSSSPESYLHNKGEF